MSTLATAVQARLSTNRIKELTNESNETATSVNSTVLEAAVSDAQAEFFRFVGQAFDATRADHIAVGVKGVLAYLYSYRGVPGDYVVDNARRDWIKALGTYQHTMGGAFSPVSPATNSNLAPSREDNTGTVRPAFDGRNMTDLVPNDPRGGGHAFDEDDFSS